MFAHQIGQWAKKVKGKLYYFGPWADPQAALMRWEADTQDRLTLKHLADAFLTAKRRRVETGKRSAHIYRDYVVICQFIANHFGKDRIVDSIRPNDFAGLSAAFAKVHGLHRLAKDVRVTRMLFKYGTDNAWNFRLDVGIEVVSPLEILANAIQQTQRANRPAA